MELDKVRDEVMGLLGYKLEHWPRPDGNGTQRMWTDATPSGAGRMGVAEPATIDGVAALWPEGRGIVVRCLTGGKSWTAETGRPPYFMKAMGDTEYSARLHLLLAVLRKMKETP
jgi:hypothetical protein